jgi:opacity protein-like surface antigen
MERLQTYDLYPFWIRGFDHGLTWFRLYLGGYPDLTSAENAGDRFIQKKIIPLYTVDNTPSIKAPQFKANEKPAYNQSPARISEPDVSSSSTTMAVAGQEIAETDAAAPNSDVTPPLYKRNSDIYFNESGLSIGIRASQYSVPEIDDFTITRSDSNGNELWYIDGKYTVGISLPVSLRINRFLRLEGCPEFSDTGVLNTFFLSLRPKLSYTLPNGIEPFMNIGLVYGVFDWQGPPGDFDDGVGWEAGFGVNYPLSRFSVGGDVSYRNIKFTYNPPAEQSIISSSSDVDFSGYAISLFLEYRF